MSSKYIDKVTIQVKAGNGGNGCKSFYRDLTIHKGIPDGGSGGSGGDVYIKGNASINTLIELSYNDVLMAENGVNGLPNQCNGAKGKNLIIQVPFGTECKMGDKTIEIIDEKAVKILDGGKGAKGNSLWRHGEPESLKGEKPEFHYIDMQVKTIGDIGLVGLPNAGKSSFLNKISNANVEVGDYAFTTIKPHLGMWNKIIFVDIPGIIEKASEGKGMGLRFLAHIERCKYLMILIDATDTSKICDTFHILQKELQSYGINKDYFIVLNKVENSKKKSIKTAVAPLYELSKNIFFISVHKSLGMNRLLRHIQESIKPIKQISSE
jgi:GTP-binding protein